MYRKTIEFLQHARIFQANCCLKVYNTHLNSSSNFRVSRHFNHLSVLNITDLMLLTINIQLDNPVHDSSIPIKSPTEIWALILYPDRLQCHFTRFHVNVTVAVFKGTLTTACRIHPSKFIFWIKRRSFVPVPKINNTFGHRPLRNCLFNPSCTR